jgi:hypothetical protein
MKILNIVTDITTAIFATFGFNLLMFNLLGHNAASTLISFVVALFIGFNIRKFNDKLLGRIND